VGGNAYDWAKPLEQACNRRKMTHLDFFAAAAKWGQKNGFEPDTPPYDHTHHSMYRQTIERRQPPFIPKHVRGYIAHTLKMNDVVDVALMVRKLVPVDSPVARCSASRRERYHRPRLRRAIAA
jgi:hypothetical protein